MSVVEQQVPESPPEVFSATDLGDQRLALLYLRILDHAEQPVRDWPLPEQPILESLKLYSDPGWLPTALWNGSIANPPGLHTSWSAWWRCSTLDRPRSGPTSPAAREPGLAALRGRQSVQPQQPDQRPGTKDAAGQGQPVRELRRRGSGPGRQRGAAFNRSSGAAGPPRLGLPCRVRGPARPDRRGSAASGHPGQEGLLGARPNLRPSLPPPGPVRVAAVQPLPPPLASLPPRG